MHTTTRDVAATADDAKALNVPVGTNILTNVMEGDGAVALCSVDAKLSARVISINRTDSGGIAVQTAVFVSEPAAVAAAPPPPPPPTREELAIAYFTDLGMSADKAKAKVAEFGADRVLAMRDKALDDKLAKEVAAASK